jgi:hypothetical protein
LEGCARRANALAARLWVPCLGYSSRLYTKLAAGHTHYVQAACGVEPARRFLFGLQFRQEEFFQISFAVVRAEGYSVRDGACDVDDMKA